MYDSDLFEMYTDAEHGLQTNRIPLRIYRRKHSIQSPVPLHSHNFWEIALVLSGTGRHVVYLPEREEIVYPISDGDVCMIAPGEKHSFKFEPGEELEIINLLFNPLVVQRGDNTNWDDMSASDFIHIYPYIPAMKRQQFQIALTPDEKQFTCEMIERLEDELKTKAIGYNTMAQLYFSLILTKFMRVYYSQTNGLLDNVSNCIQMVVQYISRNYNHEITLERLAEYTHFSVRHLTRKFKTVMEMSIAEYILQQRISNAKILLQSTDRKIEDVALESGFNSVSYFCLQFKKATGMTPQQYRKTNLSEFP